MERNTQILAPVAPVAALPIDSETQHKPWKIAFRVKFHTDKFGLRFHPAKFPDTGNGIYNIRLLDLTKELEGGIGPAEQYNAALKPEQQHLTLRPGLYLTHINDVHLISMPCEVIIQRLQTVPRPVTLRFADVEAGIVTQHELRKSLHSVQVDTKVVGNSVQVDTKFVGNSTQTPKRTLSPKLLLPTTPVSSTQKEVATSPAETAEGFASTQDHVYKIILLGTTGVGKSSILAVGINGDNAYAERRATTLEAEFGTMEVPNPDITITKKIKARIWDTAGQERYRAITRSHYRRADGALLVYDVADPESFEKLPEWLHTLKETAGDSIKSIMVIENKADQLPEKITGKEVRPPHFVNEERVKIFCRDNGLLFARTSAKMNALSFRWDGQKVSDVVNHLVLSIHATRLARGMSNFNLGAVPLEEHVVLKENPANGTMTPECSSCSTS